jgi:streptogramin lyase
VSIFTRSHSHRLRAHVAVASIGMTLSAAASLAEIPEALEQIVFGDEKRTIDRITLEGVVFDSLKSLSDAPYLMWPVTEGTPAPFERNEPAAAAWLDTLAEELGFAGFRAIFRERTNWRANEVWVFDLVRRGLSLHGARLEIHWSGKGAFLGVVNHTPGRMRPIEDGSLVQPEGEWVYHAVQQADQTNRVVASRVERMEVDDRSIVSIVAPDGGVSTIMMPLPPRQPHGPAQRFVFTEYTVPVGTFPDQISVAPDGMIWLSQPNNNWVTSFNPITEQFTRYNTTGGSGPDGLIVGTKGRVWTGLYFAGGLGVLHTETNVFENFLAPYSNAAMAIPVETTDGHVWVTDHAMNRISEFNPTTETWIRSIVMPISNCWVVQGFEDRDHGQLYFTEYNANRLGRIAVGGSTVTDIITPGGGPAFCVYSDGKVYYSRWNESGIGAYDVTTNQITEYEFPIGNEQGGPLWLTPDGKIVTGTRNRGYLMIFNPATERFASYAVPTQFPGFKDGLTVAPDGTIWFTESSVNKIGKLRFVP